MQMLFPILPTGTMDVRNILQELEAFIGIPFTSQSSTTSRNQPANPGTAVIYVQLPMQNDINLTAKIKNANKRFIN